MEKSSRTKHPRRVDGIDDVWYAYPLRLGIPTTQGSLENWTGVCINGCFKMGRHSHSTEPVPAATNCDKLSEPPVFIIGGRQITELHKNIDKADVSLLLQQLGGDRAECSLKVLPIRCHCLCDSLRH